MEKFLIYADKNLVWESPTLDNALIRAYNYSRRNHTNGIVEIKKEGKTLAKFYNGILDRYINENWNICNSGGLK